MPFPGGALGVLAVCLCACGAPEPPPPPECGPGAPLPGDAAAPELLWRSRQNLDVALDTFLAPLAVELWADGSAAEDAGATVVVELRPGGDLAVGVRHGRVVRDLAVLPRPGAERLRVRLRDQDGTRAALAVERWQEGAWAVPEVLAIDDGAVRGAEVRPDWGGPLPAGVAVRPLLPAAPLSLHRSPAGLVDWKLFQRGPAGTADLPLLLAYRAAERACLRMRVTSSGAPLPGLDWVDRVLALPAAPDGASVAALVPAVPAGGNYRLEAHFTTPDGALLGADAVEEIAVGDMLLAAGQSNMAGYPGALEPAESPAPEVHLFGNDYRWRQARAQPRARPRLRPWMFGNDYRWRQAREPMDDSTDQVNRVSVDNA